MVTAALVAATFLLTRAFFFPPCPSPPTPVLPAGAALAGGISWPSRGYGTQLDLRIYVYEEDGIDRLAVLMRGRDGCISPESCVKGQTRTQVKIHWLLLKSSFRTMKKEEVDLFFAPSYVKCVRMMGGLNDKEGDKSDIREGQGDRTDKRDISAFNTWKDIIILGNFDDAMTRFDKEIVVQPLSLSNRKYLANFLGRSQGKAACLQLLELAKQFPDKECVPVILLDQVELPFQNVIDYTRILIKWPSTCIDEIIERLIAHGRRVRCMWVYSTEKEPCSVMSGILWETAAKGEAVSSVGRNIMAAQWVYRKQRFG